MELNGDVICNGLDNNNINCVNADEVLEEFEEYWEDINDRLLISRMVGDSLIKGMVSAVEQDALERITTSQMEADRIHSVQSLSFAHLQLEHCRLRDDLFSSRNLAIQQIDTSCFDNLLLHHLKSTVDTFCCKTDDIISSSRNCLCQLHQHLELSTSIQDMVMQTLLKSVHQQFEDSWTAHNAQCTSSGTIHKFHEISSQLDSVLKSLSISEAGLVSHGSYDFDNSPHKATLHHAISFSEENGTSEASDIHVAETYDFHQLKHMTKEDLVKYFNNTITNLRRAHESALHEQAEKYFRLKREYRGPFVAHRKDEEFDMLRKKIPEVILKLENILLESETTPKPVVDVESIGKLNDKVECLLSENLKLGESLTNKENEVKHLEALISESSGKLLNHSLIQENMRKLVAKLNSDVEDSGIEASLNEEVFKCVLKELIGQKRSDNDNLEMELLLVQENYDIILRAASTSAESSGTCDLEDSDIESSIVHGVSALMFKEAVKDVIGELNDLHQEVLTEKQNRASLETKVLEKESELRLGSDEKERLKQEILSLGIKVEDKEKLVADLSVSLSKERDKFKLAFEQVCDLTEELSRQQSLASEATQTNRQRESISIKFQEALEQIAAYKTEVHKIKEKLDQTEGVLTKANKERDVAFALAEERLDELLLSEAREKNLKKDVELSTNNIHGLTSKFTDFECRMSKAISESNMRLDDVTSQLAEFTDMASALRTRELGYKRKLEWKCADLKTAETEVDLLGDEVDNLLRLLEKIYIALDHYSPILKHYTGIIEILELVKRELSGESTKRPQSLLPWKEG